MARRIALGNHKGGAGKTTAVVNLAWALANLGKRVLVVDMDPQANASRRLGAGFDPTNPVLTTSEIVHSGEPGVAAQAIRPCGWKDYTERISVIPARFDLDNRQSEAATVGAVLRLDIALQEADDDHDYTLLDLQPSLAHLVQLALAAAHDALAVTDPEYDGVEGALRFQSFVTDPTKLRGLGNPGLRWLGCLVNGVDGRLAEHAYQVEGMDQAFGAERVWQPVVPRRSVLTDAAGAGLPLSEFRTGAAREVADIFSQHAARMIKETS